MDQNYNVGTGKRTSLKELAEMLLELTGSEQQISYAERSAATLVKNRIGDPRRAAEGIGYEAQISLEEGLKRLIDWRASDKEAVAARKRSVGIKD